MRNKILLSLFLTLLIIGVQGKYTTVMASLPVEYSWSGTCVSSPVYFTVDNSVTNTSNVDIWSWDFGDGIFSTLQNPVHTYAGPGNYTAILTITDKFGVTGSVSHLLTIKKLPIANIEFSTPDCNDESIQFTDHSSTVSGNIEKRVWDFNDGSPLVTVVTPADPNPKHTFPNTGTFNVKLTVTNTDLCENQIIIPVTVVARPKANFYFSGECEDQLVTFTDASSANSGVSIVSHSWDFGDVVSGADNASNLQDPSHIFPNAGSYLVKLTIQNFNNCQDTISKQVVIKAHPAVDFTYSTPCQNKLINFTPDPVVVNFLSISSWHWDFGDGNTSNTKNPSYAYAAAGSYPVSLTVTDVSGCINVATHLVVIDPLPVAHFSAALTNCAGTSVLFQDQSTPTAGFYIAQWQWDFGDGNVITINHPGNPDISHVYPVPNNYNVSLTIIGSNGCNSSQSQLIKIVPNPVANFDFTAACIGATVDFTDLTQANGAGSTLAWQWNFGDASSGALNTSVLQNAQHEFLTPGNHLVQLAVTAGNSCTASVSNTIVVNPAPAVNFSATNTCQNNSVIFTPDGTVMNLSTVSSWLWDFGTGVTSVLPSPTYAYVSSGSHNVTLTITDNSGCSSSILKPVNIIPQPVVNFSHSQPVCNKTAVQFTNLSDATPAFIATSVWDFGDGNSQTVVSIAPVSHTYALSGTYTVTLSVTTSDGCKKSSSQSVIIVPEPLANFSFQNNCINSPVQFIDLTQAGSGGIASWNWKFGDALSGLNNTSLSQNPAHSYNTTGTFQVTLIVSNTGGCSDTISKPIVVHSLPGVDFTFSSGCVNNPTQFVSSTLVNSGAIASRQWSFGDGGISNSIDPLYVFTSSGSYTVTLTVTDTAGCSNTKTRLVDVLASPISSFTVSAKNCSNNAAFFTNSSSSPAGSIISYYWEFGDGKDTTIMAPADGNASHVYTSANNYTVTLTVRSSLGCETKSQRSFNVSASPVALFSSDNTCESAAVNFFDLSIPNSGTAIVNWSWNFGDPVSMLNNTSTDKNPDHTFTGPGTYNVTLIAENATGCSAKLSKQVVVKSKPAADFSWDAACLGNPTMFTINPLITNIANIASFDWDFGDGTQHNTTQKNPVHTYSQTSDYTVTLTITNAEGCKNVVSHSITILPKPTAIYSLTNTCEGISTQFTDQSLIAGGVPNTAWHWDFGVPNAINDTSVQQNQDWIFTAKGIYYVKLTVTSQNGCQDIATRAVQIFGKPTADFNYTATACENGNVNFSNSSYSQQSSIVSSRWEFDPENYSNLRDPSYVFYATDSCYNVRLIVSDLRGCIDTVVKEVCVPADFDFTFNTSSVCIKDTTYFTPQLLAPLGGSLVTFRWDFGDMSSGANNNSTSKTPSHFYAQTGTYTISLEATDVNNCSKVIYKNVTINPLPVASFDYTKGLCDSTIYFNETSYGNGSNINRWVWSFGDGVTSTVYSPNSPDVSHQYRAPGTYKTSLTVFNENGCSNSVTDSNIVVNPCLTAAFGLSNNQVCQNNTMAFNNTSFSSLTANIWYWDFGDGTHATYDIYSNQVTHKYKTPGAFTVKLILSTYVGARKVSDTAHLIVNVSPSPLPDFSVGTACNQQSAVFTDKTSGSGTKIVGYSWSFGEPDSAPNDTSSLKDPSHLYGAPGTYEVTLKAENLIGCRDSVQKSVVINGLPVANFSTQLSCAGNKTLFNDMSLKAGSPITHWSWTFYDNLGVIGGKDIQDPAFIFKKSGEYSAQLKITDSNGCRDSISKYISTWDVPKSEFAYEENFDNVQGQVIFNNTTTGANRYYWTFGNGEDSYANKPIELYANEGSYEVTMVAYNDKGCSDTASAKYDFMVKSLYIPTAFSPLNPIKEVQLLKPVGINLKEFQLEIFDRWGNLIWWTDKLDSMGRPTEGWDGKYKDLLMPEGAYPWRAYGVFKDGTIWEGLNVGNTDHLPQYKVGTASMIR